MPQRILDFDTYTIDLKSWADVVPVLEELGEGQTYLRMLFTSDDASVDNEIIIVFLPGSGFVVTLLQEACDLIDPELNDDLVDFSNFGNFEKMPRNCCVDWGLMIEAAHYFFEHGGKAPHLHWFSLSDSSN